MGDEQWQVAGSAAQVYERQLVPAIFGPWAPRVVALAAPAAGERVLDAACGTGVVARLAAERVGSGGRWLTWTLIRACWWWRAACRSGVRRWCGCRPALTGCRLSLASVMGPGSCPELGTTWSGQRAWWSPFVVSTAVGLWRRR
jgi:hypothetical protein